MPKQKRYTLGFGLLCLAVAAGCALAAFWFAVPLQPEPSHPAPETRALTEYVQVDLNTADAAALATLPGVGARRAEAILAYRAAHGPFARVEDAVQVPGITQAIVDSWEGQAMVR